MPRGSLPTSYIQLGMPFFRMALGSILDFASLIEKSSAGLEKCLELMQRPHCTGAGCLIAYKSGLVNTSTIPSSSIVKTLTLTGVLDCWVGVVSIPQMPSVTTCMVHRVESSNLRSYEP